MDKFINKKSVSTHTAVSSGSIWWWVFVIFPGFPKNYVLLGSIAARL